jgi:hypothetical protein
MPQRGGDFPDIRSAGQGGPTPGWSWLEHEAWMFSDTQAFSQEPFYQ